MNPGPNVPAPKNLREAYERTFRCRPEHFQRNLLSRSMPLRARFLFFLLGWFRPHTFNPDWTVIEAVGDVRTAVELEDRISDFEDLNLIDRSRRRGWFGVRVSSPRLRAIVRPLIPKIAPPDPATLSAAGIPDLPKVQFAIPRRVAETQVRSEQGTSSRGPRARVEELEEEVRQLREKNEKLLKLIADHAVEIAQLKAGNRR
jgi:hypothetical protein